MLESFTELVRAARRSFACDSVALLRLDGEALVPYAMDGLREEAVARRYVVSEHPRLARIIHARAPVHFDDDLPDPFDGLFSDDPLTHAHACMGCPLIVGGDVVGALVFDALAPSAFDRVSMEELSTFTTMATDVIQNGARASSNLVGTSREMERIGHEIDLVAPTSLNALITGETGVGKELVAHAIHAKSSRANGPMVHVNCAALPESLAESELFGHIRGAFTGAIDHRIGKFELADRGTLFLDEIGELPLAIQPKLLRVLQSGEVQRIGSDRTVRVDVRVIAATNRDLAEEVRSGRFRADLFYRLGVFPLHIPSLRDRRDDIPVLSGHFLELLRARIGIGPIRLTPAARRRLREHDWPGNIRELDHTLTRAALRARECHRGPTVIIDVQHLGLASGSGSSSPSSTRLPLREAVDRFTRSLVQTTLRECGGNWAETARRLGLQRGNLHRLAARLRILKNAAP